MQPRQRLLRLVAGAHRVPVAELARQLAVAVRVPVRIRIVVVEVRVERQDVDLARVELERVDVVLGAEVAQATLERGDAGRRHVDDAAVAAAPPTHRRPVPPLREARRLAARVQHQVVVVDRLDEVARVDVNERMHGQQHDEAFPRQLRQHDRRIRESVDGRHKEVYDHVR